MPLLGVVAGGDVTVVKVKNERVGWSGVSFLFGGGGFFFSCFFFQAQTKKGRKKKENEAPNNTANRAGLRTTHPTHTTMQRSAALGAAARCGPPASCSRRPAAVAVVSAARPAPMLRRGE